MYDPPPNSQTPPPAPNVTNLQRVKGCCEICVDFGYFKNFLFYFKAIAIVSNLNYRGNNLNTNFWYT